VSKINILIVEDDYISAEYLKKLLLENKLDVIDNVDNAKDALSICKNNTINLILMDIMIKGNISGCELALTLRQLKHTMPIIFLSAYSSEQMIEYALCANAYSYLLKPYRDTEIISTIKMALQLKSKSNKEDDTKILLKNNYLVDVKKEKIYKQSQEIFLSEKLLKLIILLAKNRGSSISNEQISLSVWGNIQNINTIRALIHRLKRKLPDLDIHNINKNGYVIY